MYLNRTFTTLITDKRLKISTEFAEPGYAEFYDECGGIIKKLIVCTDELDFTCLSTILNRFEMVTYIDFLKLRFWSLSKWEELNHGNFKV